MSKKQYKVRHTFLYEGKRYDVKGDSELEVAQKMAAKIEALKKAMPVQSSSTKVKDFALFCFETYRKPKVKELTYKKYINRLNNCILSQIGDMRIQDVKRIHCQQLLNELEGQGKYQISQTKQMLKFIFEQAQAEGLIARSPVIGLSTPKGSQSTRRSFTQDEEAVFLKVASSDHRYNIFLLSYYCGCRPDEARRCLGSDITIINETPMLHIRGTKTAASDRLVPIDPILYEKIKDTPPRSIIAPNAAGNFHNEDSYYRAWNNLRRNMNIEMGCKVYRNELIPPLPLASDLTPYCLRHTFCTNLQRVGVDLRTAQRLMGHSDITMTANIYTHVDTSEIIKAAKLMKGK